jgi:hypothetical protein
MENCGRKLLGPRGLSVEADLACISLLAHEGLLQAIFWLWSAGLFQSWKIRVKLVLR